MMLAGAVAIAARAQPPSKGSNIFSLKNWQIQFLWDGYLLHVFGEHWSFVTKIMTDFKRIYQKIWTNETYSKETTLKTILKTVIAGLRTIVRTFIAGDW